MFVEFSELVLYFVEDLVDTRCALANAACYDLDGDMVEIHVDDESVLAVEPVDELVQPDDNGVAALFIDEGREVVTIVEMILVALFVADEIDGFAVEDGVDPGMVVEVFRVGGQGTGDTPEVGDEVAHEGTLVVGAGVIEMR